jgi:membrane associated rhomboid family serine protease
VSEPIDISPARQFRDTLVRLLVAPESGPAALLVDLDDESALLHLVAEGAPALLLTWSDGDDGRLARHHDRVQRFARSVPAGGHIVVILGAADAQLFLSDVPSGHHRHHVGPDGVVWSSGSPIPALEHAVRDVIENDRRLPLIDPSEVAASRARLHAEAGTESAFVDELHRRKPIATPAIVALCLLIFGLESMWEEPVIELGATNGELIFQGQWWRLFTGMFLHGGAMHVAANMWSLWALGRFLEQLLGTPRFVLLYLASGVAGAALSSTVRPEVVSVGASGAIFGLLGALAAIAFRRAHGLPGALVANLKRTIWQPILINAFISFLPGIDAWAHAGGATAGLLIVATGSLDGGLPGARRPKT